MSSAGAGELVARKDSHYGWLRREERKIGVKSWAKKFVVITEGHMYIFKSDTAKQPQKIHSLSTYNVVKRADSTADSNQWCFVLETVEEEKAHHFSCVAEKDRQAWIGKLKYAMTKAHDLPTLRISDYETCDFSVLEKPIIKEGEYARLNQDQIPSMDSDDENLYEELPETPKKTPEPPQNKPPSRARIVDSPLPPTPEGQYMNSPGQAAPNVGTGSRANATAVVSRKPSKNINDEEKIADFGNRISVFKQPEHQLIEKPIQSKVTPLIKTGTLLRQNDYFYDSNDEAEVARLLEKCKEPGTYLLRRGIARGDRVLAVYCGPEFGTKEFKILEQSGKKFLVIKDGSFDLYDGLFAYYKSNKLPMDKPVIRLKQPYTKVKI